MSISRRDLLRLATAGSTAVLAAGSKACAPQGEAPREVATGSRKQVLSIPPLAQPTIDAGGRRVFELTARTGEREFLPGRTTPTWGLSGDYLGPTLRARRGDEVRVNLRNELNEATSLHWHGMHLPPTADGGPHQLVEPGQTWSPSWRILQPATTLWYHPHPHGQTEKHIYRGMAGLFIIEDDEEAALSLPRRYGVDDIPVILQDKRFNENGEFEEGDRGPTGLLGNVLLVNGSTNPYQTVVTETVRLRILNASTARIYNLGFTDDRQFHLIGSDGGLLAAPFSTNRIQLSPAERVEIVVSLEAGERAVLHSFQPELHTSEMMSKLAGGHASFDVLELRADTKLTEMGPVPRRLVGVPRLDETAASQTRIFELNGRQINGKKLDMDRIDEVVRKDSVEVWELTNRHSQPHSFHIHDVQYQILSIDGTAPPPQLAGWKDTVYLPPGTLVRIIMKFADYADPQVPYMYHCHLLAHEDAGMMGQFVVLEADQQPGMPVNRHHHSR